MNVLPLLAQTASQTVSRSPQQQKVWLVALILAVLAAFLCLLGFLLAMRLYRRGKRPRLMTGPTDTDSAWAAAGGRLHAADTRAADGVLDLPTVEELSAEDEPFWDAEAEDDDGEAWGESDDEGNGDGDEPWR